MVKLDSGHRGIRNMLHSLRFRLSAYFLLFGLVPVLFLGTYAYVNSAAALRQRVSVEMETSTEQYAGNIGMRLDKITYYMDFIFQNPDINKMVLGLNNQSPVMDVQKKKELFGYLFYREENLRTSIIFSEERSAFYVYKNDFTLDPSMVFDRPWRQKTLAASGRVDWVGVGTETAQNGTETKVFTVARAIKDITGFRPMVPVGYIYLSFSMNVLAGGIGEESAGSFYLLDEGNNVILSHHDAYGLDSGKTLDLSQTETGSSAGKVTQWQGRPVILSIRKIPGYQWRVVRILPYSHVTGQIQGIAILTGAIGLGCLAGLLFLSLLLSKRVASPLIELDMRMRTLEGGDFDASVTVTSRDEIGHIQEGFNHLASSLKALFARTLEAERQKREEEIKALQYQVNPHFLYNTLNSIRLMARLIHAQGIEEMTGALIRLLKNAVGKAGPLVPLEEEVQSIRDFIYIQQIRYGERIDVAYEIPDNCRRLLLPNFILQPVVENAIFHGIIPHRRQGIIRITAQQTEGVLSVHIIDNGMGIPPEELDALLAKKQGEGGFVRIGLANVNQRIQLGFGSGYGVTVESKVDCGTEVLLRLPVLEKQEEAR